MNVRCLVRKDGELYVGMSLEFGLACQARSLCQVQAKLQEQIEEYIDGINSEKNINKKLCLIKRKGPRQWYIVYYIALTLTKTPINFLKVIKLLKINIEQN